MSYKYSHYCYDSDSDSESIIDLEELVGGIESIRDGADFVAKVRSQEGLTRGKLERLFKDNGHFRCLECDCIFSYLGSLCNHLEDEKHYVGREKVYSQIESFLKRIGKENTSLQDISPSILVSIEDILLLNTLLYLRACHAVLSSENGYTVDDLSSLFGGFRM
eukprot:m.169328 g.169328  ORF g.169328 m.169328 type:complete len:163 (-) comp13479_c0_seq3:5684-6172(-)